MLSERFPKMDETILIQSEDEASRQQGIGHPIQESM
jgi:hypothetical protein